MAELLKEGIYRVCIPFEDIYTTSFILAEGAEAIILDGGASAEDAQRYVVPAVEELGVTPVYLISSHQHGDHCGGMEELEKTFPSAKRMSFFLQNISDNLVLLDRFRILNLKGHCDDSLAILDTKTGTLLSCDCLQMYGVSKYGGNFDNYILYIESLNRLRDIGVNTIVASHSFVPYGDTAEAEKVDRYLDECERVVLETVEFTKEHLSLTDGEVAELFNSEHMGIPPISDITVRNIRKII